jgi:hypothetical protein
MTLLMGRGWALDPALQQQQEYFEDRTSTLPKSCVMFKDSARVTALRYHQQLLPVDPISHIPRCAFPCYLNSCWQLGTLVLRRCKRWKMVLISSTNAIIVCPSNPAPSLPSSNSMTLVSNDPSWWPVINGSFIFSYFLGSWRIGRMMNWFILTPISHLQLSPLLG